jgi:hypothetical protein
MNIRILSVMSVLVIFLAPLRAQTWDGDTSTTFTSGSNWVGGVAPAFPTANIFFPGAITPFQPNMNNAFQVGVQNLEFLGAGWTVSDTGTAGGFRLDASGTAPGSTIPGGGIYSTGSGVNTINAHVIWASSAVAPKVRVDAGNTLVITGTYSQSKVTEFSGAGTFVIAGPDKTTANFNTGYNITNSNFTLYFNSVQDVSQSTNFTQGRIGGTGGLLGQDFQTTTFSGGTLAPGGNGTYGAEIESFQITGESASRHELTFAGGTTLEIQIGSGGVGNNDQLLLDLNVNGTFHAEFRRHSQSPRRRNTRRPIHNRQ